MGRCRHVRPRHGSEARPSGWCSQQRRQRCVASVFRTSSTLPFADLPVRFARIFSIVDVPHCVRVVSSLISQFHSIAFLCSLHCQLGRGTQPLGTCGPRAPPSRLAEHCLTLHRSKRKQACLGLPVWAGSSRMTSEASKQPTQKVRHCTVAGCVRHCTVARCVRHCTVARCVRHCTVARCVRHCTVAGCVRHCTVAAYVVICVPRQLLTCARFSCDL
jgi:hypothetical protein